MGRKTKKTNKFSLQLHKTILDLRYKPTLKHYELLFPAAQALDEYPHWKTDGSKITLADYERHCSITITHNVFNYHQDLDKNPDQSNYIERALTELPRLLEISSFARFGFRQKYLFETPMGFEEVCGVLNIRLFSQDDKLEELLPPTVEDLAYILDCADGDTHFHVKIGPLKKEEVPRRVGFSKDFHLAPENSQREFFQIEDSYPLVSILLDIDVYRYSKKIDIPVEDAIPFYKDAKSRVRTMVDDLTKYLFT